MPASASAIVLPGVSLNPRGIVPPAPDGMTGWWEFSGTDRARAARNLRNPSVPGAFGANVPLGSGYARFSGSAADYFETYLYDAASFAAMAVFRTPGGGNSQSHRVFSSTGVTNDTGGSTLYTNASDWLTPGVIYSDNSAIDQSGPIQGQTWENWSLVCMVVEAGVGKRVYDLTKGTQAITAKTTAHVIPSNAASTFWLGTTHYAGQGVPGPVDIHAIAFTIGRAPSKAEIDANAALMRQRAALAGITV